MATVKIEPQHLGAVFRAAAKQQADAARLGLRIGAERGRLVVLRRTPVGVPPGAMRQAWKVVPWRDGWSLDNTAPHAGIVEAGARPHPVSREGVEAIREWVARVIPLGITTRGPNKGKPRKLTAKQRETDEAKRQIDKITWAIVHKLKTKGQAPRWIVKAVLPELAKIAGREVAAAVKRAIDNPKAGP